MLKKLIILLFRNILCFLIFCSPVVNATSQNNVDYCANFNLDFSKDNHHESIPKNWEEASNFLFKALPIKAKEDFLSNEGTFSQCFPNTIIGKIAKKLEVKWRLRDNNISLVDQLNKMGFWTVEEKIRLIVAGVYIIHLGESFDANLPTRQKFLQEQDAVAPEMTNIPCELLSEDLIVSDTVIAGFGRFLRWGVCSDGKILNYLWERGWFEPSRTELVYFCQQPLGDQETICKEINN